MNARRKALALGLKALGLPFAIAGALWDLGLLALRFALALALVVGLYATAVVLIAIL